MGHICCSKYESLEKFCIWDISQIDDLDASIQFDHSLCESIGIDLLDTMGESICYQFHS